MGKNKLDAVNFCRILDMFGEEAARGKHWKMSTQVVVENQPQKNISMMIRKPKNSTLKA